jgi:AbrB family looped-hinge helix DNA binding protein
MGKVTSKLQVTVPKAIADQFHIRPGDDLEWIPAADAIRVVPARSTSPALADIAARLKLFDQATERQQARQHGRRTSPAKSRGWTREELYSRGRAR